MFTTSIFFSAPPSLFINAMSVLNLVSSANAGYSETMGKHMRYSKFSNSQISPSPKKRETKISSRTGMLFLYTPAFFTGLASFSLFPDEGLRFLLLTSALTFHFFKRIFEVIFIHKYSGGMTLDSTIVISISYFTTTATTIYAQHLTQGLPEPTIDLKYFGTILFLLGVSGNFYHHYLLSKLRGNGEKKYKTPTGGLFDKVICPHYLFELLGFWGFFFIGQTLHAFCCALGVSCYLVGRSIATRSWYISKFEDFPNNVKAIFPYIL